MATLLELAKENVWQERYKYEDAEQAYHDYFSAQKCGKSVTEFLSSNQDSSCNSTQLSAACDVSLPERIAALENDNSLLKQTVSSLEVIVKRLETRVTQLEKNCSGQSSSTATPSTVSAVGTTAAVVNGTASVNDKEEEDDDFELFGDDEEDEEAERVKQERVKAYEDRKAKKPVLIAKSNIILDIKPWDDETNMGEMEKCVRSIEMDGLLWGSSKLVPLAYTIKKLQISCVVEDDKVSTEDLEEKITAFEDYVQSVDIAAFNKI